MNLISKAYEQGCNKFVYFKGIGQIYFSHISRGFFTMQPESHHYIKLEKKSILLLNQKIIIHFTVIMLN